MEVLFDSNFETFIEVLRDKNTIIPVEKIKQNIILTINNYFSSENMNIGMTIDLSQLYNLLSNINGIESIKTGYLKSGDQASNVIYYNGLSFACWSKRIMNGKDFEIFKGSKKLEEFQFPILVDSTILNLNKRIRVVSQSFSTPTTEF